MKRRDVLVTGMAGLAAATASAAWSSPIRENGASCEAAIRLLLAARREAGLAMPEADHNLMEMSRRQAAHMAETEITSHFGHGGDDPVARIRQTDFVGHLLGETLAETYESPAETMAFWLSQSSTHEVLMEPTAAAYGVAAVRGRDGRLWLSFVSGA